MNGIQKEIFGQLSLRNAQFRIISHFQHTVHNCVAGCDNLQSAKYKTSALSELVDTQAHIYLGGSIQITHDACDGDLAVDIASFFSLLRLYQDQAGYASGD